MFQEQVQIKSNWTTIKLTGYFVIHFKLFSWKLKFKFSIKNVLLQKCSPPDKVPLGRWILRKLNSSDTKLWKSCVYAFPSCTDIFMHFLFCLGLFFVFTVIFYWLICILLFCLQAVIKQGDALLNRIQKLSRVIDL